MSLALLLATPYGVPRRAESWNPSETAVWAFVLAILSLVAGVSTFALRENLREELHAEPGAARVRRLLLGLWARCLAIGLLGALLAWAAASPAAGWPFLAGAAALLLLHAPREWVSARPDA